MFTRFTTSAHFYKVQEILGESQLSVVYLAHRFDKKFQIKQPVVIKLFKSKDNSHPALQMESLLRARHSFHLVKALSFESFQSRPALILEYIHGINLKQLIKNTELTPDETACICSQVLTGLKELKKNGLTHGDLSLSNILVDIRGHVYLTDYGLANYKKDILYSTEPFTAPELYKRGKACFQSDLFSLGVLEKVLSGRFSSETLNHLKSKHFICKGDALLDPDPQNRRKKDFPFSPETPSALGNKVHQFLFIKNCFYQKPASSVSSGKKKPTFFPYRAVSLCGLFLFLAFTANPFISYGEYMPPEKPARVLIRTQQWTHVQMAGITGYTPVNIPINQPGTYKLKWKQINKQGSKFIYIKSGQEIILRDHDFP